MATPSSPSASAPFLALAAALALALSAARHLVPFETALVDTVLLALLAAVVWANARARYGERGAGTAALALVLFAPVLGAVGGGGLPAALLLTAGLTLLIRGLLDPTVQRAVAAGVCLGLAIGVLHVEGAARRPVCAALAIGAVALVGWRILTAERCEPRRRVVQGAVVSVVLGAAVSAAVLLGIDALPPFEPTEYARVWAATAFADELASRGVSPLLVLNALPLLGLAMAQRPRRTSRYADGATVIGLAVALAIGIGVPVLLAVLAAPWLALLAGAAVARARGPGLLRLAAAALLVQALSAALLWPEYPRASAGWAPLPAPAPGVPI
ncbi:hypothetical protein KF840_21510 [bacterium]|nr:hypothetical protein [bacterium]